MIFNQHGINSFRRGGSPAGTLPDRTIRLQMTSSSVDPTSWTPYDTSKSYQWARVAGTTDTWDCTYDYTDWSDVFRDKTGIANVIGANLINVTSLNYAFGGCSGLLTVDGIDNTATVTNASYMFYECNELTNVSVFDTSSVTNMLRMFEECRKLVELPFIDTSSATDMTLAFSNCRTITKIPQFDLHNAIILSQMLFNCTNLVTVPDLDTRNAIYMNGLFQYCTNLKTAPNLSFAKAGDVSSIFASCTNLTNVPNYDMTYVTYFKQAFYYCFYLPKIPNLMITTTSGGSGRLVTNVERMFSTCKNVESGILDFYNKIKDVPSLKYTDCFEDCGVYTAAGLAEYNQLPSTWT